MRPVRLSLENFTCFRGDEHTIDFTAFDLFAISGPTGAGKTSILDGIIYALYGKVPRLSQNLTEMISQGRKKMAVTLDFQVRGERYRVVRKTFDGRPTEAQLERLEGERRVPMASGVRGVGEQIARLLGLGFEAFTQSVVLPQGEFSKFIKSKKAERNDILTELLRLGIFDLMRKSATGRRDRLSNTCASTRDVLEREYAGATPAELERRRQEFHEAETACQALDNERTEARRQADELKGVRVLCSELEALTAAASRLEASGAEMDAMRGRIEAAQRAERVRPVQTEAARAAKRADDAAKSAREAAAQVAALQEQVSAASDRRSKIRGEAEGLTAMRERQAALAAVVTLLPQMAAPRDRLAQAAADREKLSREVEAIAQRVRACRETQKKAQADLEEATQALAGVGYVPEVEARYNAAREDALDLRAQRRRQGEVVGELARAEAHARARGDEADKVGAEAENAEAACTEKSAAAQRAHEALEAARLHDLALTVRQNLAVGEACPVCARAVDVIPETHDAAVDFQGLEKARDEAARACDEAARTAARKGAEAVAARQSAGEAAMLFEAKQRETSRIEEEIARLTQILTPLDVAGDVPIEERILAEAVRLTGLRTAHETLRKTQADAERAVTSCATALAREEAAGEVSAARLNALEAQMARDEDDLKALAARVEAVTKGDAKAELDDVTAHIAQIERRLAEAEAGVAKATAAHETAVALASERAEAAERDGALSRTARQSLDAALQNEGFADEAGVAAATMERAALEALEAQVRRHQDDLLVTTRRLHALETELRGRRVTAVEAQDAEARTTGLEARYAAESRRLGELRAGLDGLASKVERAAELRAGLVVDEAELVHFKQLCDDLRSDRFQTWILDDTFKSIVRGASERLMKLTQRYEMEVHSDAFYVLDNDNAREKRSADTLSGGETFLASLALALELSEQIQAASGAVRLDSLFIDEGFGTLDPETLDTVAQALEALTDGGRMVGIITHIAELTERLPARLLVKKQGDGARVVTEG